MLRGADIQGLEAKIQANIGSGDETGEDYGQGLVIKTSLFNYSSHKDYSFQMELNTFIDKTQCECLNESDDHPLAHSFTQTGGYLQSDCDEQLIMSITFNQAVKIHSLKFKAPLQLGPKDIKIFINQPRTIDFDMAETCTSVQDLSYENSPLHINCR